MEHHPLWAPWRLGYITGEDAAAAAEEPEQLALLPEADADCFLCQAAVTGQMQRRMVVARGPNSVVVLNRYPYNNGHLLVAPLRHWGSLDELPDEVHVELMQWLGRLVNLLQVRMNAEGFNIGLNLGRVAGAGLPGHLHWHIVPRWNGDTNFMPALAGIKVIPQSLDSLWELLSTALASESTEPGS